MFINSEIFSGCMEHTLIVERVKLGKKGQLTIPKKIRDEDGLFENDTFIITHSPGGDMILRKAIVKTPEQKMLEIIEKMPRFDARKAWIEVLEERKKEHR